MFCYILVLIILDYPYFGAYYFMAEVAFVELIIALFGDGVGVVVEGFGVLGDGVGVLVKGVGETVLM